METSLQRNDFVALCCMHEVGVQSGPWSRNDHGRKSAAIRPVRRGPGGRPSAAEAERRQKTLLDCAARLFLDEGFDAVSIDEISRRSGVAKRFIYARFKDKSELFVAAIGQMFQGRMEPLHAFARASENVEDGLFGFAAKLLEIVLHPDALAVPSPVPDLGAALSRTRAPVHRAQSPSIPRRTRASAESLCRSRRHRACPSPSCTPNSSSFRWREFRNGWRCSACGSPPSRKRAACARRSGFSFAAAERALRHQTSPPARKADRDRS